MGDCTFEGEYRKRSDGERERERERDEQAERMLRERKKKKKEREGTGGCEKRRNVGERGEKGEIEKDGENEILTERYRECVERGTETNKVSESFISLFCLQNPRQKLSLLDLSHCKNNNGNKNLAHTANVMTVYGNQQSD